MKKMEKRKRNRQQSRASFTVEASLLMALILPVLVAILLTGFYLHDRGYLQGAAIELAAMGSNLRIAKDREAQMSRRAAGRTEHALLWGRQAHVDAAAGEEVSRARAVAVFPVPALAAAFWGETSIQIDVSWERRIYRPAQLIWQMRAAGVLAEELLS